MFTGIVTDVGTITFRQMRGDLRVQVATKYNTDFVDIGASIACDGICLTVVDKSSAESPEPWLAFDISAETISKTNVGAGTGGWQIGHKINLERALRVGDELGGHIVSGHVDGLAEVVSVTDDGASTRVSLKAPNHLARFIAQKGSIALNGTSLTVNDVMGSAFGINLIPHTKTVTTWGNVRVGDQINLEIDTLARYVARLGEMQG